MTNSFGHLRWWPEFAAASASAPGARLPRPLLRPPQARRPGLDGIEQRPIALLQHVAVRERRAELESERAQHAVVAVVALQHDADERRCGRTAAGTELLGDFIAPCSIEFNERFSREPREMIERGN